MLRLAAVALGLVATQGALAAPAPKPPAFAICGACHNVQKGGPNGIGPNLWGVGGRVSGKLAGFNYSPAMSKAAVKWDRPALIAFINDPRAKVPGTRMVYAGQKNPAQAAAIADYLLSLK